MNESLKKYILEKRAAKLSDDQIRNNLIANGWKQEIVDAGLRADLNDSVPMPSNDTPVAPPAAGSAASPVAVVNTFTTRGLEYLIMFISLWISATALGFLLHSLVDGALGSGDSTYSDVFPVAAAAIIVAFPIFALLFLYLKKQEINDPSIREDASRKRAVQLTLIVTFIIGVYKLISYIYSLLNTGNESSYYAAQSSVTGDLLHTIITLGIAGTIFAYYWRDLHKPDTYKL